MTDIISDTDFKNYAGINHSDDDSRISDLVTKISDWVKSETGRSFITENRVERVNGGGHSIEVRNLPIDTVNSIKDTFESDPSALDSDTYDVDDERGLIYRRSDSISPLIPGRTIWPHGKRRWKVDYDGGYGSKQDDIPEEVKIPVLSVCVTIYNDPDLSIKSISMGNKTATRKAKDILRPVIDKLSGKSRIL